MASPVRWKVGIDVPSDQAEIPREQEGCPSDRYDSHWEDRPSDQQLDYGPTEPLASDRYVSALDGEDEISRTSYDEGFKSDELDYERVVSQYTFSGHSMYGPHYRKMRATLNPPQSDIERLASSGTKGNAALHPRVPHSEVLPRFRKPYSDFQVSPEASTDEEDGYLADTQLNRPRIALARQLERREDFIPPATESNEQPPADKPDTRGYSFVSMEDPGYQGGIQGLVDMKAMLDDARELQRRKKEALSRQDVEKAAASSGDRQTRDDDHLSSQKVVRQRRKDDRFRDEDEGYLGGGQRGLLQVRCDRDREAGKRSRKGV